MRKFNLTLTVDELSDVCMAMMKRKTEHHKMFGDSSIVYKKSHDLFMKILRKSVKADNTK